MKYCYRTEKAKDGVKYQREVKWKEEDTERAAGLEMMLSSYGEVGG